MSLVVLVMGTVGDALQTISTTVIRRTDVEIDGVFEYDVDHMTGDGDRARARVQHRRTDLANPLLARTFEAIG